MWDNIDPSIHDSSPLTFKKQYRDVLISAYDVSLDMMTDNMVLKHGVLYVNCSPLLFQIAHFPLIIFPLP